MAGENDSIVGSTFSTSLFPCGKQLSPEWKTLRTADQRIYFYNLRTRSTHWFPPPEFWVTKLGLPYGWEAALDNQNDKYYINHVTRITTREDPRSEADQAAHVHMTPPQARRIELVKDAIIGFGFVAGSEKPVVIRSVIPNGPSHDKLFANDQILKVNGEDVRDAAQADVIKLIKSSNGRIELEVVATEDVQDTKNQHQRKSSLMSRTTRERRRSTPVSVRFADEPALVQVIGPAEPVRRSSVPLIPNVLKVFLENGQTRSFRYDSTTTVEEIFNSFGPKLDVKSLEHFSLVLSGPKKGRISYIQNHEKVSQIYTNRNCSSVNCLCKLNIAFVPKDHFELLTQDPNTFEYLYAQVTNRVVEGFYGIDLKYDLAIKLAALHIQQKALEAAAGRPTKMSVRQTEREFGGLGKFLPSDHLDSRKEKDLRKTLEQQIKQNENLASPGEKHMSSLQCKIHYLNLASEIFSYGGRYFVVQLVGSGGEEPRLRKAERQRVTVLVSLKYGVSRVVRGKINVLCQLADFKEITGFSLCALGEGKRMLRMRLQEGKKIELICSSCDSLDLIALITGYYRLYVDNTSNSPLPVESEERWPFGFPRDPHRDDAPDFYSKHRVVPDVWSYPSRFQTSSAKKNAQADETKFFSGRAKDLFIDLSRAPPRFQESAIPEESDDGDADTSKVVLKFKNQGSANPEGEQPRFSLTKAKTDDIGSDRGDHADTLSDVPSEDEHLLDAASSLLSNSLAESDRVGIEPQSDSDTDGKMGDDRDEQLTLPKQRQGSSENLGKESWTVKSEDTLEDHEGLKSELGLAGEIFQIKDNDDEVNSQDNSNNEARITDNSGLATESDSWVFVGEKSTHPESNGDKKEQESLQSLESVASSESNEGQPRQTNASFQARISLDSTALLSSSVNGGQNTTEISRKRSIPARIKQDSLLTENNVDIPKGSISEQENPHHLDPASLDGPFLNSDPCQDRSPSPSLVDLGFDESKFDNKGIILSELTEVESNSVESGVGSGLSCTSMEGSEAGDTDSAVEGCQSQSQLREDGTLLSMQSNRVCDDSELPNEAVKASHHNEQWEEKNSNTSSDIESKECRPENENVEISESEEDSDDSDESDLGEQENGGSLWETFPEFFQPSSRHKYTGNKQGELCLFEEDGDKSDILSSTESDRNIVLVSHSKLGAKVSQKNVSTELVDRIQFGVAEDTIPVSEECEELSIDSDSSGDVEFVYEVNPDLSLESWTLNGEEGKNGIGCNDFETSCDQDTERSFPVVLKASPDGYVNDCKISIVRFVNLKENGFEQSKLDQSNSTEETTSQAFFCKQNNIFPDMAPSDTSIKNPNDLPENNIEKPIRTSGSDASVSSGKAGSVSLEGVRDVLDRSYSPSDWIIPTPPTSTAELDDFDIHVVSPPPSSPDASDDDAFDDEIMDLMVPPPPSSCNRLQTLSGIKAVSPPPMDVKESETLDSSSGYIDTRFISLTDDHKLAQNKVLESKLLAHGNLMGQQKPPPQQADNDYSLLQREAENMNLSENQSGDRVFTKKSHLASKEYVEESCNLRRNNHSLYNQAFPSGATRFRFHKNQVSFSGSPSTVWSSEQTAVDVKSSCGATQTVNHQEDDLPRHDAVTETSFSRPAVSPKQKPSIPPKPLYTKTTNGQGWLEENKPVLTKATKFESPNTLVKSDYESMPQRLVKLEERRISRPSAVGVPICDTYSSDLTSFSVESVSTDFYVGESNPPDLVCKTQNDLKRSDEFVIGYCIDKKERKSDTEIDSRELCGAHIPAMPSTSFTQDTNPTKATSFGRTSPYVPTPYSPTRNLNRNQKNSALKEFESTRTKPLFSRSSCRESSSDILGTSQTSSNDTTNHRFTSSMHAASSQVAANNAGITGNSPDQRKIPLRHVTNSSSTSSLNVSSRLGSNSCDTFRILPEVPMECSNVEPHIIQSDSSRIRTTSGPLDNNSCVNYGGELPTIENTHVICRSHSPPSSPLPLPDSPPPPLPDSSPPKIFPRFDDVDFDFGEPQIEPTSVPCSNDTSPISHARHSVDMSSSLSDSKGKVSLQHSTVGLERSSRSCYGTVSSEAPLSSYRKHNSTKNIPYEISGNASSENLLSASLNLPSLPRVSSRRSLSEDQLFQSGIVRSASDCKRFSLSKKHFSSSDDDSSTILSTLSSDPESLKTKCSKVCKEALSTISVLNKKLETCLNGKAFNSQLPDQTTKWPLVLQNSARFLACDVKIISSNVKRGSPQVVSALHTSLDSLGKLVESCEGAYITSGDRSRYDVRTLVVLVNEVLELFRDVVITVEAATGQPPEHPDVKVLADKTAAMATLVASLIRTLRKH